MGIALFWYSISITGAVQDPHAVAGGISVADRGIVAFAVGVLLGAAITVGLLVLQEHVPEVLPWKPFLIMAVVGAYVACADYLHARNSVRARSVSAGVGG